MAVPFQQPPPPLPTFSTPSLSDTYARVGLTDNQTYEEAVAQKHSHSQYSEGLYNTSVSSGFESSLDEKTVNPSGFEAAYEAAYVQEQHENESRGGPTEQFSDQMYMGAGLLGEFEISTFSIDDVNGSGGDGSSSSSSRGRKITGNQGSENGGDDNGDDVWPIGEIPETGDGWWVKNCDEQARRAVCCLIMNSIQQQKLCEMFRWTA